MIRQASRLPLFPLTAEVNTKDHLMIGGCDSVELAMEFGTPLYIYDEVTLREKCTEFKREFGGRYPTTINYSCKAFINKAVLKLFAEEGLGLDVVSGGEIGYARAFGFPMERIDFPGNNKSAEELTLALESGVGHIVVDNLDELELLQQIAGKLNLRQKILLRITPGVDPKTHRHETTGNRDSKFGIPMAMAAKAVGKALAVSEVQLTGLHFHIGSQITDTEPYIKAIGIIMDFAAEMKKKYRFELKELSVGGGYAHRYTMDEMVPSVSDYAEGITGALSEQCRELDLEPPHLIIEPGRSMVAGAGVALYTTGVIKDIPGIRRYVSIDGGMADNVLPAFYQVNFEAVAAAKMNSAGTETVTICGKYCESSDILIRDIELPEMAAGDIIAIPGCGAYNLTESTNYNMSFRPAVVIVKNGDARLIRRRETLDDLTRCDLV
ncbi:MAG: diaminopimelate decarboxylase [Chloroflexi bacterium RBG_13_46_14]|nr:MAG: diaminopimelate decarboxylase [Chloroflexi bacterium RBG_13_46_14]